MTRTPKSDFPKDFGPAVRDVDENFDPYEQSNPIPWPLLAIAGALVIWGGATLYFDLAAAPQGAADQVTRTAQANGTATPAPTVEELASAKADQFTAEGAALFGDYCATCHQPNGAGVRGAIPPLDGSRYVTATSEVPIAILLRGIAGPIEVKDVVYDGRMPTLHDTLSNDQIARILTYVRGAWSNSAGAVTSDQVQTVRAGLTDTLNQPWQGGSALEATFDIPSTPASPTAEAKP